MDELEERLTRRDRRFVIRLVLTLSVVLFAGLWAFLEFKQADPGGCAARGFGILTDAP